MGAVWMIVDSKHFTDVDGNPAGGYYKDVGIDIRWQDGPLGRGENHKRQNGAFVESVLTAALDRLQFYQRGKFACEENARAIEHVQTALVVLRDRTARREEAGIEGTNEIDRGGQNAG